VLSWSHCATELNAVSAKVSCDSHPPHHNRGLVLAVRLRHTHGLPKPVPDVEVTYDIADDPRYEATPKALSVVVSRSPSRTEFSRAKMLRLIGLPRNATWEDANPILKDRIVTARNAGDVEAAAQWSQIRDALEKRLASYCECGTLIGADCGRCGQCAAARRGELNRKSTLAVPESFWSHLGKYSDTKLSKIYGVPRSTMCGVRKRLGIKAYDCFRNDPKPKKRRLWAPEIISRLGTMSDAQVAATYRLCRQSVIDERKRRGIRAFDLNAEQRRVKLSPEVIALLGRIPDRHFAKRFGVSRDVARSNRRKRGIPVFRSRVGSEHAAMVQLTTAGTLLRIAA
jgi:hypothetical protein